MVDLATTPVATGINPPPSPLGNLSGILGIQQQAQNLQTGQYKQQEAQAGASQAQQQNSELQALAAFTKNAASDPSYQNPDGSANVAKFQRGAMAVAPTYGQAYIGQMTQNFNGDVENRKALLGLGQEQQKTIATALQSIAQDPNASHESAVATIGNLRGLSSDPAFQGMLDRTLGRLPNTGMVPDKQGTSTIQQWAARAAAATGGPALASPSSVDQGGQIQPGATSNYTGAFSPSGTAIPKVPGIMDTPAYKAAIAAATAGAGGRATGTAGSDIDRANQVSANIKAAPATIQTSQQIDALADQIHSGKFADAISKAAAAVGQQSDTYARQLLKKDLGIIQTQLTAAAPSDSRAATILSGTPDATSDAQTIHGAMDYVRGTARQNLAQGQNLNAYKAKRPDLSGFQAADDAFTGAAGPLVHESSGTIGLLSTELL
jgi:hypothetical protein